MNPPWLLSRFPSIAEGTWVYSFCHESSVAKKGFWKESSHREYAVEYNAGPEGLGGPWYDSVESADSVNPDQREGIDAVDSCSIKGEAKWKW